MISAKYFLIIFFTVTLCHANSEFNHSWFLESIHTPSRTLLLLEKEKVVIAIVDDGMRISHNELKKFIWINPNETPDNNIDDDGNGVVDDIHGWDVSDNNNTFLPPQSEQKKFYHGTHLAGIMAQIANASIDGIASDFIKFMPVKTLSDRASDTYLRDAYKGVEYAIDAGADIILVAWGVGHLSAEESRILEKAERKGILVIASSGNIPEERKQYPAAFPSVIAVSALNQNDKKIAGSNFGQFVDLSAPGVDIYSSSVLSDSGYEYREGTSFASAMTAAAVALIKLKHPNYSANQVRACLKTSTSDLNEINPIYRGKLGAGKLDIEAAINCSFFTENDISYKELFKTKGYLRLQPLHEKKLTRLINPQGEFKGLRFTRPYIQDIAGKSVIKFFSNNTDDAKLIASYSLATLPETFFIPVSKTFVTLEFTSDDVSFDDILQYEAETIDFKKQYCKDTIYRNEEGMIEDGSGNKNYAFHSNCKWLITAPPGKVIKFNFTEFETETKTDMIYFFDGSGTHEKIMAIFSGSKIPPKLTTWNNQVLIWFVSDHKNQGKGWKANYIFIEK